MLQHLLPEQIKEKFRIHKKAEFMKHRKDSKEIVSFRECSFFAGSDNKIEAALIKSKNSYDWENFQVLSHFIKPNYTCFDIGANIGVYSLIMARLTENDANVHSFEPVLHIRDRLAANARLNGFNGLNLNDFALGAEQGSLDMYQVKKGVYRGGTSTFIDNENIANLGKDNFEVVSVKIDTLDNYVISKNIKNLDFIKIDVEGFEQNVLMGGKETFARFKPTVLMEYDLVRHEKEGFFTDHFIGNGYQAFEFRCFGRHLVLVPFSFDRTPFNRNILCLHPSLS